MKKRKIKKSSETREMKEEHTRKTAGKNSVFSSQEDVYSLSSIFAA